MDPFLIQEMIKATSSLITGVFTSLITEANKTRLAEKKLKKEAESGLNNKGKPVILGAQEILSGVLDFDIDLANKRIQEHIKEVKRWANQIKFKDLPDNRSLTSIYVNLDTYLVPARIHVHAKERESKSPFEEVIVKSRNHCVILGQPGAGKTTSLKRIVNLIEENKFEYTFPILLKFRDLTNFTNQSPILNHILKIIPLTFDFKDSDDSNFSTGQINIKQETTIALLNHLKPIIILDGYDEIRENKYKEIVLKELTLLFERLRDARIVLSCRTGELYAELNYSNTYEIAPLSQDQIKAFVYKWLMDESKAESFLDQVKRSPYAETSIKPLTLAHLCAIFERIGSIPEQPKTVYRKVVNLLLEEWDQQRQVIRTSTFNSFQSDQKYEFLCNLAFKLTVKYRKSVFSIVEIRDTYKEICLNHGLPRDNAASVVDELEAHTGLFLESGYQNFEFVHKSIQEFLTADYIVKLSTLNTIKPYFENLGSELAIAVSISSNSSLYFIELVLSYLSNVTLTGNFYQAFTSRLIAENPVFSKEDLTAVAALVMLSYWINPGLKKISQYVYQPLDKFIFNEFSKFITSLKMTDQKNNIFEYYEYKGAIHNNSLVELRRKRQHKIYKRMPSKIYIPVDLYQLFV